MVPFFVQIKCHLGKSYDVANRIADAEIASEIYSTAGEFDLLVKFYVDDGADEDQHARHLGEHQKAEHERPQHRGVIERRDQRSRRQPIALSQKDVRAAATDA